ncbi:SRPBCC family protein [Dyadobacter sp. LJ53]|uniref:SRPBCC family protein n=1 Tax=Dyadobacter chenwenxiniae TaxID=2906456 RepID=UPI001F19D7E0|nr:SRPBCC family protein [Dyadobacter chenwenxiniae]MCF0049098.1 SRPBCC family protein [Dyadobacter chenwenxiniae]
MEMQGKIIAPGVLYFERFFDSTLEKVWKYVTDSEKRGKWLAKGDMELFEGGRVDLYFMHNELSPSTAPVPERYRHMQDGHHFTGKVLHIKPPHLLSFTWEDGSEVTIELSAHNDGVLLRLTHRKLADDPATRLSVAAGWHTHMGILQNVLEGSIPPNFWLSFHNIQQVYEVHLPEGNRQ